jgi:ATPase subunit of ABC transporter with duplicated ATPase domains
MLSRFDSYLLDEPTNDLDLDRLDRLERWVESLAAPVALVSHDRTFLSRSVTHVIEIDEFTRGAREFAGGEDTLCPTSRCDLAGDQRKGSVTEVVEPLCVAPQDEVTLGARHVGKRGFDGAP